MARWLGGLGLGILTAGALTALAFRLGWPTTVMEFGFQVEPAAVVFSTALLAAGGLLTASLFIGWSRRTANRKLAAQAEGLETERRRFIQRLDHELKNPLTAIQVHLDNLQEQSANRETVAEVRAQADRLAILTRGLRRLADLETRALEVEKVAVDELLEEVVELLQAPARIQLDIQRLPWPIPPIDGDRELLLLVFRNLVDNALKYSSGPTQVRARHTIGHLVVEVIDTGRGILTDELPLVTGELYRGSNTRDVSGSGLGLAMVQRIIERHGGRLELRSRAGQGTIATVQIPYEQTAPR